MRYEDVMAAEDLWEWLVQAIVPLFYGTFKYNKLTAKLSYEMNFIAGYNRLIGGMFLMQKRGTRLNSEYCDTKFRKFYPICYSETPDTSGFGPNVLSWVCHTRSTPLPPPMAQQCEYACSQFTTHGSLITLT